MKIISLEAENIKKIKATRIEPNGKPIVILKGKNGVGKTTAIDCISYALGGAKALPEMPITKGEDEGRILLDLGDIVIKWRGTQKGKHEIAVENKDGLLYKSPQALLDGLYNKVAFDPEEFIRINDGTAEGKRKQLQILKSLVGLNFSDLNAKREKIFNERAIVNREIKSLKVNIDTMPKEEAPEEEVSFAELAKEQEKRIKKNQENEKQRALLKSMEQNVQNASQKAARLKEEFKTATEHHQKLVIECDQMKETVSSLVDMNTESIKVEIAQAERINMKVRLNKKRDEFLSILELKQFESETLTKEMEEIETKKAEMLSMTKFPIEGLSFDETGVTLSGIPFDQCSSADQWRVSASIGLAAHPKLSVLLIRNGSLLDEDNLILLGEMVEKMDGQVWIERVSEDKELSVVIQNARKQGERGKRYE